METITLNGKEYVLKSDLKKIEERNVGIMDRANVCMFFKIENDWSEEEFIKIPKPELKFKVSKLEDCSFDFKKTHLITPNGTKINYEYFMVANRLINAILGNKNCKLLEDLRLYEGWDDDKKLYKKDYPVLLTDSEYGLVIAPRVNED